LKEDSVPALKIGVELAGLRLPFRKALHTAAESGADAVEIDARGEITPQELSQTGVRQLRKLLEDHRLRVSAVRFRTRRGYDAAADLDRRIAATKAAMEFAYRLGATVVVNHVGRVPADPHSEPWRLLVEVLGELGRHGSRAGALLAAETGTESGEDLARLLAELPEGTIGVDLNPANLVAGGFSPVEAVEALGPSVLHVHATDAVRDSATGRGTQVSLGEGTIDYPALLAALDELGYRGYFTVTHHTADDPAEAVAEAIRYLRDL
jgi:sugar phosphate isomerase/epimerase